MPTSNLAFAPRVIHLIWQVRQMTTGPFCVIDVGPGHGKYATLIREYVDPETRMVGIEAWEPYVSAFRLDCIYDEIVVGDVCEQRTDWFDQASVVLMADVIEHLERDAALRLFARVRPPIVFSTPRDFFANPDHLPHTETHRSHWTREDFAATGRLEDYDASIEATLGGIIERLEALQV